MAQKTGTLCLYALTSSDIDRFSNLFHCQNQKNICNNTVTKDLTTPRVCRYTALWNVTVFNATIKKRQLLQQHILRVRRPATFDVKTAGCDSYFT